MVTKAIKERLVMIERHLANAERYVTRGVNVEGLGSLHLDDWSGNSGHPEWMKNYMIPTLRKQYSRDEQVLEAITDRLKDKRLAKRRRQKPRL